MPASRPATSAPAAHLARGVTRGVTPLAPRLLALPAAAQYLGVSPWTMRDLEAAGVLPRVRVPLPNGGELRKLLFDREDLDRVIATWKDRAPGAGPEAVGERP